jgi:hypothetical protein
MCHTVSQSVRQTDKLLQPLEYPVAVWSVIKDQLSSQYQDSYRSFTAHKSLNWNYIKPDKMLEQQ